MTTSVDVVIPTFNRWDLTERCLELLRVQTIAHSVIVADNGSTDGTPANVRAAFADAHVVELGENRGFSAACNAGAFAGTGDVVVLLNNDVECSANFLERLTACLHEDSATGSVAGLLLMHDGETVESLGMAVDRTLAGYPRFRGAARGDVLEGGAVLAGPSGAAAAFRREAWDAVGGLDEAVIAYGEDVDLALRLREAGWSAAAARDAVAIHIGSASAGRRSKWQRYQGGFSRGYFLRRYGVLRGPAVARALATEMLVVAGDALVYSRDLAALRGRITGWRAAAGLPRRPWPPGNAVDESNGFSESLRLRRNMYVCT